MTKTQQEILEELTATLVFDRGKSKMVLGLLMQLRPDLLRVATAFLGPRAFRFLTNNTDKPFKFKMLAGFRDEGQRVTLALEKALVYIKQMIRNGPPDETRPVLMALYRGIKEEESVIKHFEAKHLGPLHAKVYIADELAVLVGSPNFSDQGMIYNIESLEPITDLSRVAYHVKQFDHFFEQGTDITPQVLEILENELFQDPLTPYQFYQLCLHHLYPKFSGASDSFILANYQRDMVTMALRMLQEEKRCLFIAPTGTGKTVMGCEIATQFQKQMRLIDRVVVICPSGLELKWKEHMDEYGISCDAFSHQEIGYHDSSSREIRVNKVLSKLDDHSMLIVDESHNYRNLKTNTKRKKGQKITSRVHQLLKVQGRMNKPYSLALTATPYSRGWKDVETQLAILGQQAKIKAVEDLDKQPLLHITLPFITQKYADQDEQGAYLNMGSKTWRFDTIEVITKQFSFQYPKIIEILEGLTYVVPYGRIAEKYKNIEARLGYLRQQWGEHSTDPLTGRNFIENPDFFNLLEAQKMAEISGALTSGALENRAKIPDKWLPEQGQWQLLDEEKLPKNWTPFRIPAYSLLKAALSSPQAFIQITESHLSSLHNQIILNREQVRGWLRELLILAQAMLKEPDAKAQVLVDLCTEIPKQEKILIFCESIATSEVLRKFLTDIRPNVTLITGEMHRNKKLSLIRRFAPVANRYTLKANTPELFTVVATDCISEGMDIQDAKHLINYDLPWSPLKLVQRLGRLDRPSPDERIVKLYNFTPPPDISNMILNFYTRLKSRSDVYKKVSRVNLLDEETRTAEELMEGEAGFIRLFLNPNLTIDQLRDWTATIKVTNHLLELSKLTPELRQSFEELPAHVRSARRTKTKPGYFILFKCSGSYHILITDPQGQPYPESLFETSLTRLVDAISCQPEEPLLPLPPIEKFDNAVGHALRHWAMNHRPPINPDEILEIGAIALL